MQLSFGQKLKYFEVRHPGQHIPARDKVSVCCAHHGEKHASCTLFLDGPGGFNCHGCGAKGSLLQFEMLFSNCSIEQAKINIAKITGAALNENGGEHIAEYVYFNREGIPVAKKDRYETPEGGKRFTWSRYDEAGRWRSGLADTTPRLLYNAHELTTANLILEVEGEKCAEAVKELVPRLWPERQARGLRIAVTTNPEGAWEPGTKPKWRQEYNKSHADKDVVLFEDNDAPGKTLADYVSAQIHPCAASVHRVAFPDRRPKYDIADWIKEHDPETVIADFEHMIETASLWQPPAAQPAAMNDPWASEGMDTFLTDTEEELVWLEPNILAQGCLTQIFAPRGVGKSVLAAYWAVKLVSSGKRVLMLDRDNSRRTLMSRLRSLGAYDLAERKPNLRVITREKCPPLTKPDEWAAFPYAAFDVVIVDAWDSMAEGVGEQDSTKPARAIATLLDICRRENGPAVLLLGNTIKSAEHSRGSGVVEDRADIVYEVRDATTFCPTGGDKPWIEELPKQGASEWAARSSRRKGCTRFRLALVSTKFRLGEEPAPRMLEVSVADEPWTVRDVTLEVDQAGEGARREKAKQKADYHVQGVNLLRCEILRRTIKSPILKKEAERFLMDAKFKRVEASAVIADPVFRQIPGTGKGHPLELHLAAINPASGEMDPLANPCIDAGTRHPDFSRPHVEHTGEMEPSEPRMSIGEFESAISPETSLYTTHRTSGSGALSGANGSPKYAANEESARDDGKEWL